MSSNLPISSKYRSTPEKPVDEAERADLTQRLNDAYADGALDVEEYQQRMDRLFAARNLGELVPVVDNLPSVATHQQPGIIENGTYSPGDVSPAANANRFAWWVSISVGLLVLVAVVLLVLLL